MLFNVCIGAVFMGVSCCTDLSLEVSYDSIIDPKCETDPVTEPLKCVNVLFNSSLCDRTRLVRAFYDSIIFIARLALSCFRSSSISLCSSSFLATIFLISLSFFACESFSFFSYLYKWRTALSHLWLWFITLSISRVVCFGMVPVALSYLMKSDLRLSLHQFSRTWSSLTRALSVKCILIP